MNAASSRIIKVILIIAGTISLALGVIGIFLPLLPTTPFLLLAAACYAGGSKKFYGWLINNRLFGSYIRNYREGKGIELKVKVVSVASLWITIGYSAIYIVPVITGKLVLIAIAACVTAHILSRPTIRGDMSARS